MLLARTAGGWRARDAGHGGHDTGALGAGTTEAKVTLDIALRLEQLLCQPTMSIIGTLGNGEVQITEVQATEGLIGRPVREFVHSGKTTEVAILHGALTALNAQQRVQGFEEALANYPDIEIVAVEPTEDDPALALSKAEALLQAYPDLAAFYGVTGVGVPGAAGAVKGANLCGKVVVVGFDVVPQGIEGMRDGCVQALISQRPFGMTAQALEIMISLAAGNAPTSTNVDTGVEVVTPEGLETFLTTDH